MVFLLVFRRLPGLKMALWQGLAGFIAALQHYYSSFLSMPLGSFV
jgi:hypothetical protein